MFILILLFLSVMCCGCSPSSLEDFEGEGKALTRQLVCVLKEIQTREELAKAAPQLAKRFEKMVDLIVEARKFQIKHPDEDIAELPAFDPAEDDQLLSELKRLYRLEGGKEIVERAQREASFRLDAFERALTKQRARKGISSSS